MFKHFLIPLALATAAFAAPALAQQPAPAATPAGPQRFESTIVEYETADKQSPVATCPIVFTGSSTIRRWTTLTQDLAPLPVLNRGFGGSQIADVNYYFDRVVAPYKPRAIVFYAGDNDINAGRTPYEVEADFKRFMTLKTRKLGSTPVFVVSLKPSKLRIAQFAKQSEANMKLRELAAKRRDLTYIDVVDPMLDRGLPKDIFVADGLHMTADGYKIWTAIIGPVLRDSGVVDRKCRR
jgi:lysophospholipase L1-like esterase